MSSFFTALQRVGARQTATMGAERTSGQGRVLAQLFRPGRPTARGLSEDKPPSRRSSTTVEDGPGLPALASGQVSSCRGYTGRGANALRKAARDPKCSQAFVGKLSDIQ